MDKIVKFTGIAYGDLPAPEMLRNIADQKPDHAFVISWPENGEMPSYHSSTSDIPCILLRLQQFIHKYYNGDFATSD